MLQLSLDLPDDVPEAVKARAKASGKSVSAYLADLVVDEVGREWPHDFFEEIVGGWHGEPLERPDQGQVEHRERLG